MTAGAALERVEAALRAVGSRTDGRGMWQCPAHEDSTPSLSVTNGDGRVLVNCFGNCPLDAVLGKLKLTKGDLFDEPKRKASAKPKRVATYLYVDRQGEPLRRKVRLEPGYDGRVKTFFWEKPNGSGGGWVKCEKGEGNPHVLFNLPDVIEAERVHLCEGEKGAGRIREAWTACATCPPTPKWELGFADAFRDKDIVIWADRDPEGLARAALAYRALVGVARSLRVVRSRVETHAADAFDHIAAGFGPDDAIELDPSMFPPAADGTEKTDPDDGEPQPIDCGRRLLTLDDVGFSGARLLALLQRPLPLPVEIARPTPGHFSLWVAPSFTGKTSLTLWNAMARAAGVPPWSGVEARPAARVLVYSLDEAPEQVIRRMNGLSLFHPAGMSLDRYMDRITVLGPDRDLDPSALDELRFDEHGLEILTRWMEEAQSAGDPFAEIYVDAYADVIPLGETENSNEEGTRIGGALERRAVRHGPAITMLHHCGKPKPDAPEVPDIRFIGRGGSALGAKARTIAVIEAVPGMPHLLRVRAKTNLGPTPKDGLFQICGEDSTTGDVLYFKPGAAVAMERHPAEFIAPGECISTTDLARRLCGDSLPEGKDPPGDAKNLAATYRETWREAGLVVVTPGPRNAKMVALAGATEPAQ
ncbi:MAG TPA: AAA family ATPase [Myxococcota bacterium]|nr:AAA family ATPase [Myxococcota bacterium]